jgi:triosephosphate isomerase
VPCSSEFGVKYAIVGHSERRSYHAESNQLVADKAKTALATWFDCPSFVWVKPWLSVRPIKPSSSWRRQLKAVIDTLGERHVARVVVAYEPVWAIGTGKTASPEQAQAVHASSCAHS